ncbi:MULTISPECIES: L,D-transpeptidase family protein [unclassified Nocardiopsis]|uniref:L,D-transpeptidase family protein n=1 Tax=Nocardiopsis TaxID=2013 RepID=UPI00387A960B
MATPRTPSVPFPIRLLAVLLTALLGALLLAPPPAHAAGRELRNGDSGRAVTALQEDLLDLGYWLDGADGEFGPNTAQAVLALQKAAGIDRDGVVGPDTRAALADGVRPSATTTGDGLEIDLRRQLLLVVSSGEVEYTLNTSTGSGKPYLGSDGSERIAVTPTGSYTVFRQVSGWDPGPYGALYAPMYFNGGIAVHGYPSVPAYPASHGCARVSLPAMDWLREEGHIAVGTPVLVR